MLIDITTADWINIVIAFLTFITAMISLFTINEMRKQRVHSYFPDINMADFKFYLYRSEYDEELQSYFLYSVRKKQKTSSKISGFSELKIGINNVGFAVAKNVKYNWDFDIESAKKIITNDTSVDWKLGKKYLSISSKSLKVDWAYDISEDNSGGNFNFILPYSNEIRRNEIVIPQYFIDFYWLYMSNLLKVDEPKNTKNIFPPLSLKVQYTDIHSNELEKIFLIKLEILMIATSLEGTNDLAKFKFKITEKKTTYNT